MVLTHQTKGLMSTDWWSVLIIKCLPLCAPHSWKRYELTGLHKTQTGNVRTQTGADKRSSKNDERCEFPLKMTPHEAAVGCWNSLMLHQIKVKLKHLDHPQVDAPPPMPPHHQAKTSEYITNDCFPNLFVDMLITTYMKDILASLLYSVRKSVVQTHWMLLCISSLFS